MRDNTRKQKLAMTPPMGWNSWNMFGWKVREQDIKNAAKALVDLGLKDLGYEYVVIDDCWSVKDGRDNNGNLVPDPGKFPGGMQALAAYVHSLGLKIGIYSDAAETTCAGYPGSFGYEQVDAAQWASWGFDFLKYDYCAAPPDQATAIERYTCMGQALKATGREFLYSICEWGGRSPHLWGSKAGGHMWRVSGDVFDSWVNIWVKPESCPGYYGIGIDQSMDLAAKLAEFSGPGKWNDLDMLVVGLGGKGQIGGGGLNALEYRTHMSIWSIACSPLMIGCDLQNADKTALEILGNPEIIAVNQDPLGIPGRRVLQSDRCDIWKKPLKNGDLAVAIVNRGSSGVQASALAGDLGLLDTPKEVRDIWKKEDSLKFKEKLSLRVEAHETRFLVVKAG